MQGHCVTTCGNPSVIGELTDEFGFTRLKDTVIDEKCENV